MYQEVNSILVVNTYLTYHKLKNPQSHNIKIIQNYLTQKIAQTLESKKKSESDHYLNLFNFKLNN